MVLLRWGRGTRFCFSPPAPSPTPQAPISPPLPSPTPSYQSQLSTLTNHRPPQFPIFIIPTNTGPRIPYYPRFPIAPHIYNSKNAVLETKPSLGKDGALAGAWCRYVIHPCLKNYDGMCWPVHPCVSPSDRSAPSVRATVCGSAPYSRN